jgi:DNA-binding transcriptional MerR regulator
VVPAGPGDQPAHAAEQPPRAGDEAPQADELHVEERIVAETVELAGVYIISVAARLLEMHPQTLRKYERFGLIRPSRTAGALRLYSDQDLARLRIVRRLVEELGLNLAGVRLLMEVVSQLGQAIQAVERDEASRQAAGAREAVAHMRAVLDFVNA